MGTPSKHVILISENNQITGILDKVSAHNADTPLHRGISAFVFNEQNQLLLQRRSLSKKTWPGFWSNSFCGHPQLEETEEEAVIRHAKFELNVGLLNIEFISKFQYKVFHNNIAENEICSVYIAATNHQVQGNELEVMEFKWINWQDFIKDIDKSPQIYTPWCIQEANILDKHFRNLKA